MTRKHKNIGELSRDFRVVKGIYFILWKVHSKSRITKRTNTTKTTTHMFFYLVPIARKIIINTTSSGGAQK